MRRPSSTCFSTTPGRLALAALLVVAVGGLVLAGAALLPRQLGGPATYVVTRGGSMEPGVHEGDLVVARRAARYGVGDVVAYHSRELGTTVLHRVIQWDGDRLIVRGDSNAWVDPERPTTDEVLGRMWVRIPAGGKVLAGLRHPAGVAALVGLSLIGTEARRRQRRRRSGGKKMRQGQARHSGTRAWRTAAITLAGVAAASAALGAAATGPEGRSASDALPYDHRGRFAYSAPAPGGAVYDGGRVATGEPVYLRLVQSVDTTFEYQFEASMPHAVAGTIAMDAEISDAAGWRHTVDLTGPTPFRNGTGVVSARLDLTRLQAIIAEVQDATGVRSGGHTVTLLPRVEVTGTLAGQRIEDHFEPRLDFQLDALQLRLAEPGSDGADSDTLRPSQSGELVRSTVVPRRISTLGVGMEVSDARRAAAAAGLPSVIGALFAAAVLRRRLDDEPARIELRHGSRIVPIAAADKGTGVVIVDVTDMGNLVRLADQHDSLILHQQTGEADMYLFQVDRTVYRYTTRHPAAV